ncbi:MAG: excisionase family DNA-binding protein [Blastocatellia bacterium]
MKRRDIARQPVKSEPAIPGVKPIAPSVKDVRAARELQQVVEQGDGSVSIRIKVLEGGSDRALELTRRDFPALAEVFGQIAKGKAVLVLPIDDELSTQQAADLLNVSRPYLIKLLESNEIPFRTVGAWRRVRLTDVLAYKHKSDERSQAALQELTDQAQDLKLGY